LIKRFIKYIYSRFFIPDGIKFYNFLSNLDEKQYPKHLKEQYRQHTGRRLNLDQPKTFNEKIQYLKLYNNSPLKTLLTDKAAVRKYLKDKIGIEYVKPFYLMCRHFDDIDFECLPDSFIMKCTHAADKWGFIIKNKNEFLCDKVFFEKIRRNMTVRLTHEYWVFNGFDLNYKGIKPQILIEPLMRENSAKPPVSIRIYNFAGIPKIFFKYYGSFDDGVSVWDENYNEIKNFLNTGESIIPAQPDDYVKLAADLSKQLIKDFKFAETDWLIYDNRLYFDKFDFAPYSGFLKNFDKEYNLLLGSLINIK